MIQESDTKELNYRQLPEVYQKRGEERSFSYAARVETRQITGGIKKNRRSGRITKRNKDRQMKRKERERGEEEREEKERKRKESVRVELRWNAEIKEKDGKKTRATTSSACLPAPAYLSAPKFTHLYRFNTINLLAIFIAKLPTILLHPLEMTVKSLSKYIDIRQ